jgi:hypothetical protein
MEIKIEIFHALKMIRVMCMNVIKKVENYFTDFNIDIVIIEIRSVLTYINNLYIKHKNRIHINTKNKYNTYSRTKNTMNISKKEVNDYNTLLDNKNGNLISRFFWQKYFNLDDCIAWRYTIYIYICILCTYICIYFIYTYIYICVLCIYVYMYRNIY